MTNQEARAILVAMSPVELSAAELVIAPADGSAAYAINASDPTKVVVSGILTPDQCEALATYARDPAGVAGA